MNFHSDINYEKFLSRSDMIWNDIPYTMFDAPFIGNGFMGSCVFFSRERKSMYINLGHTCIYDNRKNIDYVTDNVITTPRLPVGKIQIDFTGKVQQINMRLDLYNAVLSGDIRTSAGRVKFSCLIFNDADCLNFRYEAFGNENITAEYIKSHAMSPREYRLYNKGKDISKNNYDKPRDSFESEKDGVYLFTQPYYNGGGFSVAVAERENEFYTSIIDCDNENNAADANLKAIKAFIEKNEDLLSAHKKSWHSFWQKSFVSLDDGVYENFYNIQLYKLACASRANGRPFDTCGPWLKEDTCWPGTWWNLNVELTVSPLYTSNHLDIAHCVTNALENGKNELINNVPEKYRADCAAIGRSSTSNLYAPVTVPGNINAENGAREGGNLIWALFCCYREYKMNGDKSILTDTIYPLLKRAVQYYMYFLYKGEDSKLHLKSTVSPEYFASDSDDVNYDLSLLRWGCEKLIEITELLNIDDEAHDKWEYTLNNLTDYPSDNDEGLMIAANTHYAQSHRHYSHMLMFYPLHNIDIKNLDNRQLIEKTINFWQSKPDALQGYSQTGAASMRAMLGDGNKALYHLTKLFCGFIHSNTMYDEGDNPVLETPPSAAASILEMLLQSHDGYINIFPAVPEQWKNICFDGLLCEGGFEVGAGMTNSKFEWIKIKSLNGERCIFKANFETDRLYCDKEMKNLNNGLTEIVLGKGETAVISVKSEAVCSAVKIKHKAMNCFGLNKRNKSALRY